MYFDKYNSEKEKLQGIDERLFKMYINDVKNGSIGFIIFMVAVLIWGICLFIEIKTDWRHKYFVAEYILSAILIGFPFYIVHWLWDKYKRLRDKVRVESYAQMDNQYWYDGSVLIHPHAIYGIAVIALDELLKNGIVEACDKNEAYRYIAYNAKQLTGDLYTPQHDLMMKTATGKWKPEEYLLRKWYNAAIARHFIAVAKEHVE